MTNICSYPDCARPHKAKTFCSTHYQRLTKYGDASIVHKKGPSNQLSAIERFWLKVDKSPLPDGCWLWSGSKNTTGYGSFKVEGKMVSAHRWGYEISGKILSREQLLDHICRVRHCVNPSHLRTASYKQNSENRSNTVSRSRSGIRGVWWCSESSRWRVSASHDYTPHHGGYFAEDDLEGAEAAAIALRNSLHTYNDIDRK